MLPKTKTTIATKRAIITIAFARTKLLVPDVLLREQKLNQNHFLAMSARELCKKNRSTKRRVDKNQLVMHIYNSMCDFGRRIRGSFARKTMMRVPSPVYSPGISPGDFWFFGSAKERMKDQMSTSANDLKGKLTMVCNLLESCSMSGCQYWNGQ
jgi:hypothetical protein